MNTRWLGTIFIVGNIVLMLKGFRPNNPGDTLNCPEFDGDSDHWVPAPAGRGVVYHDASYSAGGT